MKSLRRSRSRLLSVAPSALLICTAQSAPQTPLYHVTDLRDAVETTWPGVAFPSSRSRGLNQDGDLVGEAYLSGSDQQAFIYTVEHGVVPLPLLPGWSSNLALDVSDRDANGVVAIVGGGVPSLFWDIAIGEAALWKFSTVTGTVLETRSIGIPAGETDSLAVAVNNSGSVVGYSGTVGGSRAIKYDVNAQVLQLFPFPVRPNDINDGGIVCGGSFRGDLFGNFQDLGAAPGTHSSNFISINDLGSVSGRAGTSISDGAGHFLATVVRYVDASGWTSMPPISHFTMPGGDERRG